MRQRYWGRWGLVEVFRPKSFSAVLMFACVVFSVVLLCGSSAFAARGFVSGGEFGSLGVGNGEFSRPLGVAVNEANGKVYVVDHEDNRVEWFSAVGVYEGQFDGSAPEAEVFEGPEYIAVDNSTGASSGDVYVATTGHNRNGGNVIDKFDETGGYLGKLESVGGSGFSEIVGLAVDSTGGLWVYEQNGNVDKCSALSICETKFHVPTEFGDGGIAVDSGGNVIILSGGRLIEYSAVFGQVGISEPGPFKGFALAVDRVTGALFVAEADSVSEYTPVGVSPSVTQVVGGISNSQGVAVNKVTDTVYVTEREEDRVKVFVPEPVAEPTVDDQGVTEVASSSARFVGQINPRGGSTEYHFEYDTSEYAEGGPPHGEQVPLSDVSIGQGFGAEPVSGPVKGLSPDTTYYFRLVVNSPLDVHGPVYGHGQVFTTQTAVSQLSLPDGRVWELVSPPDKHGSGIFTIKASGYPVQASASGDALTYVTSLPTEADAQGNLEHIQVLARRGETSWSSGDMALPQETEVGLSQASEYPVFSSDLTEIFVEPIGSYVPLSSRASERTPYIRRQALCDTQGEGVGGGCFAPLMTSENVPPGTRFGGDPSVHVGNVQFAGAATADLRHVTLSSAGGVPLTTTPVPPGVIYEWSADMLPTQELELVSILPESEGGNPVSATSGGAGETAQDARHAISDDGSRVFWQTNGSRHLYLRDTTLGETLRLDVPQSGATNYKEEVPAYFQAATGDGMRVFFTASNLTAGSGLGDLYVCEITEEVGKLGCSLTDLTENGRLEGVMPGLSADGTIVYFVAGGVLSVEENKMHEKAVSGENNLYMRHYDTAGKQWESARFIARLSSHDGYDWSVNGAFSGNLAHLSSGVSGNGRYLAFMSNRSLTGYDNHDARTGSLDEEVYLYDAQKNNVVCVSCNSTGGRPLGREIGGFDFESGSVDAKVVPDTSVASNIPGWTAWGILGQSIYQSRYLSNSGRVFFNSMDALVPQDINGNEDVYEFEPPGVGGCEESGVTFSVGAGGCVGLVSSGTASGESAFLDASVGGDDVFFVSAEKLVPGDIDTAFDVYDAHVCSSVLLCPVPSVKVPTCGTADSCRPAPLPQPGVFGASGSATFSGAGNVEGGGRKTPRGKPLTRAQKLARGLRACHKKSNRHKRAVCERQARKRYGPVKKSRGVGASKRGGV